MVIGAFTTLFQQKLIFGLQWIFAERRGEKAEFFVPGGPSSHATCVRFYRTYVTLRRQLSFRSVPRLAPRACSSRHLFLRNRTNRRGC